MKQSDFLSQLPIGQVLHFGVIVEPEKLAQVLSSDGLGSSRGPPVSLATVLARAARFWPFQ